MMRRLFNKRWSIVLGIALVLALAGSFVSVSVEPVRDGRDSLFTVGGHEVTVTIGNPAYAAIEADYSCDGVDDDVQFQAAVDALPAGGGKLTVFGGAYSFSATVTRAINNVTIEGIGQATSFANDGVTALFTCGGNNWVFRNITTDAGGITVGATTGWVYENVLVGATYYAYRTAASIGGDAWEIPVSQGVTFTVAASDSTVAGIAQADYTCDGTADEVQISAAIVALPATGGHVKLLEGTYELSAGIDIDSDTMLTGSGFGSVLQYSANTADDFITVADNSTRVVIGDMQFVVAPAVAHTGHGINSTNTGVAQWHTYYNLNFLRVQDAIYGQSFSDSTIYGVTADETYNYAVYMNGGAALTIGNCFFKGSNKVGTAGIYVTTYTELTIHGNCIAGMDDEGLEIVSSTVATVTGNTIMSCGPSAANGALTLNNVDRSTVAGNVVANNDHRGVYMVNCNSTSFSDNAVYDSDDAGLEIATSTGLAVTGNSIFTSGPAAYSMYLNNTDESSVSGNTIVTSDYRGVFMSNCNSLSFTDNTIADTDEYAIVMATCTHVSICGNTIRDSGTDVNNTYDDIMIGTNSNHITIEGNNIYSNAGNKSKYGIYLLITVANARISGNVIDGQASGAIYVDPTDTDVVYQNRLVEVFMDVLAATANHIVANEDLTQAPPINCTEAAQPDVPRNITITVTDGNASISAFQIDIAGINAYGNSATEQFLFAGGLVQTGNVAWSDDVTVTVTSIVGDDAGDVLDVGIGSKLGLTNLIWATGNVWKVKKNNADYAAASYTVNATYDTVDVSTGGAIVGGDDFTIYYKSDLNVPD